MLSTDSTIYVAGGDTLIGSALVRRLKEGGFTHLCGESAEPDLTDAVAVDAFFAQHRPQYVFVAAGKSAGIAGNQRHPATLAYDNLMISCNVLHAAWKHGAWKLLYLASSCGYPKLCPQPMKPEHLFTGPLEPTSEAYATAKLAGMRLAQAYRQEHGVHFIAGIPANAFGPGDDFSPENSHVCAALVRKMDDAKRHSRPSVEIWGTGKARREFIFADDLADACIVAMRKYDGETPINLSGGEDVSIRELAEAIQGAVGYPGELVFNASKPEGMPLKALDGSALAALGFRARTPLREALAITYDAYLRSKPLEAVHE